MYKKQKKNQIDRNETKQQIAFLNTTHTENPKQTKGQSYFFKQRQTRQRERKTIKSIETTTPERLEIDDIRRERFTDNRYRSYRQTLKRLRCLMR